MKRLLIASPLDVLGSPNSRTHHVVRYLAPYFDETISVSRMNITHQSKDLRSKAFFRIKTSVIKEEPIHWISVSPIFNIRQGLGLHMLGLANPYDVPSGRIKKIFRRFLSFMGILTEFGLIPSLIITYVIHIRRRADVFIGEGHWEVLFGLILKMFGRVRKVIYDDIDYSPGFQPVSILRRRFTAFVEKFGIRRADMVISIGEHLASLRMKQGAKKVLIIPNGVDLGSFSRAIAFRKAKGPRRPTLIYMGYLGTWAGVDLLIKASAIASKQVPSLRVILLGHGSPEDIAAVSSLIKELELSDVVEYRGEVSYKDLPLHLSDADIGVALFRPLDVTRYAFPLKVIEYMSAGLPVITTEGTESADLVLRSKSGVTVPFEAGAAANAIVGMLTEQDEYKRLCDNAEEHSKIYDWQGLMDHFYSSISVKEQV